MNINNLFGKIAVLRSKSTLTGSIFMGVMVGVCVLWMVMPNATNADFVSNKSASYVAKEVNEAKQAIKTIKVVITAYSSTPDQTDDTPFTTASGKQVADGIIANNMLPLGTKVRIPELYGDKVFTVEDRMNKRMGDYKFDIWFPEKQLAVNFGVKTAELEVLED
jgi:3D (Asp-Asp-Asp) domain-containing protein